MSVVGGPRPNVVFPSDITVGDIDVGMVIHEIVHSAARGIRYDHYEMGSGAQASAIKLGIPGAALFGKLTDPDAQGLTLEQRGEADTMASNRFATFLKQACGF